MESRKKFEVLEVMRGTDDRPRQVRVKAGHRELVLVPGHSPLEIVILFVAEICFSVLFSIAFLGNTGNLIYRSARPDRILQHSLVGAGIGGFLLLVLLVIGPLYLAYFWYNSVYRAWKFAQLSSDPEKRPSPGAAWAYLLLPFYRFYWYFVAFGSVKHHLEEVAEKTGNRVRPIGSIGSVLAGFTLAVDLLYLPFPVVYLFSFAAAGAGIMPLLIIWNLLFLTWLILLLVTCNAWRNTEFAIMAGLAEGGESVAGEREAVRAQPRWAQEAAAQGPTLEFFGGEMAGNRISLKGGREIIIGRDPLHASVVLTNPQVSRMHAHIRYDENAKSFMIRDLETSHGVFINGERVPKGTSRLAYPGARVEIAKGAATFYLKI